MVVISTIRNADRSHPTLLSMTGDQSLSVSARYEVLVTTDASRQLTITAGKSHLIRNVGSNNLVVVPSGASNVTLTPDTELRISWDVVGGIHKTAVFPAVPDAAMSATSPNAVQNSVAKAYADGLLSASVEALGNKSGAVALDFSGTNAKIQTMTLTGNVDLSGGFTAPTAACSIWLVFTQNATGGYTVTWPTLAGTDPVVDPSANAVTAVQLFFDGSNYHTF